MYKADRSFLPLKVLESLNESNSELEVAQEQTQEVDITYI